jgi:transposase
MITILFTERKLIAFDILSKRRKFNQPSFVDYMCPDLKRENVNFHRRIPQATFWVHVDNSLSHHGSKVAPKFEKHHVSRLLAPLCSPDMNPCEFWLFGILKGVLKDRKFNSNDEIEEVITKVWDELAFDEVQNVFHSCMSRLV